MQPAFLLNQNNALSLELYLVTYLTCTVGVIQIHAGGDTYLYQDVPSCAQIYIRIEITCGGSLDGGERSVVIGNCYDLYSGTLYEAPPGNHSYGG